MASGGEITLTVLTIVVSLILLGIGYSRTDPVQTAYWVGLLACILVFVVGMFSTDVIISQEAHKNTKKLRYYAMFAYITSLVVYVMAAYYFSRNSTHLPTFLTVIVLLIIFPATLFTTSVASIIGSNQ
jgi:hypothetical protein